VSRPHGSGSVREIAPGRWQARLPRAFGRRQLDVVGTAEEAHRLLDAAIDELLDARVCPTAVPSLGTLGPRVLARREIDGVADARNERGRWDTHVAGTDLHDIPLRDLQAPALYRWIDALAKKPAIVRCGEAPRRVSRQTVVHCLNLVRTVLQVAVREGLIAVNPAADIRVDRDRRRQSDPWTYLLPGEHERVERAHEGGAVHEAEVCCALFALGAGLRQAEHWSLRLSDLHAYGPEPRVVVRWGKEGKKPKGGKIRVVPLFGIALAAARRWLELMPSYIRRNPRGLAFPTPRGHRRADAKPPRSWGGLKRAAGLDNPALRHDGRPVRWHDLRHSCASALVAGWWGRRWSLQEVCAMLGHSSITVTQRYAHLAESVIAGAAAATPGGMGRRRGESDGTARNQSLVKGPSKPRVAGSSPAGRAGDIAQDLGPGSAGSRPSLAPFRQLAVAYLKAVGAEDTAQAGTALEELLAGIEGRCARVRAGGPFAHARAIELAEELLGDAIAVPQGRRGGAA
jgi:integrase